MEYVTDSPIRPEEMYAKIGRTKSGSVLLHYAVVRERTGEKVTTGIRFERVGDAEAELSVIAGEIRGKWEIDDVLLVRRTGELGVGDVIALMAVSCPRSKDAFEACQYGVSRLKKMTALKKSELFA